MMYTPAEIGFLDALGRRLDACQAQEDLEPIYQDVVRAVSRVFEDRRTAGVVLDSTGLDTLLQDMGRALLKFSGEDVELPPRAPRCHPLRLYLVTEVYMSGGHSRMLEDFIAAAPCAQHVVIFSDLFARQGGAQEAIKQLESRGASVVIVKEEKFVLKSLRLVRYLKEYQPDICILFNHHQDAPVIAACLPEFCRDYYFYHHADHNLCLGARVPHFRHIDISPWQFERCSGWRDDNVYIPITCPDQGGGGYVGRRSGSLVSCTAGSWVKFSEPYHVQLPSLIADIVSITKGRHIHIGNLPEDILSGIRTALLERGLDGEAFQHIGWVKSLWRSAHELKVDLYLSSFPLGGGRGLIEMLGAGIPIAFHANPTAPYMCGETFRYPGAICWSYVDQLLMALQGLDDVELGKQSRAAREQYEACFGWGLFESCVGNLGKGRNQQLMPALPVPSQDGARYYFDLLLRVPVSTEVLGTQVELYKDPLSEWFKERLPTPSQNLLINEYLQQHAGGPLFCILVLDLEGDNQKLMQTLRSLGMDRTLYASLKIIVFTPLESPATTFEDKLNFIKIDPLLYVDAVNLAVEQSDFDWLMLVCAGEEFTPSGLMIAALELIDTSDCHALFGDELQRINEVELGGTFRPAFNLDLLLSFPAGMAKHWLIRRDMFLALNGYDPAYSTALEFDLLLRLLEQHGTAGIGHVAEPLLIGAVQSLRDDASEKALLQRHLYARGYVNGDVASVFPGRYRLYYGHDTKPLVSIIIPSRDQLPVLRRCVESLLEKTSYQNYELLIVDNNSETREAQDWFLGVEAMGEDKLRILRYPQPFNYSAINNMAAREARGEYLVLLNNDTVIISESWLDELLNQALRPEVGIVGAKLLFADGRIRHAGTVLGLRGPAGYPFIDESIDAVGYMHRLQVVQNYTAVTAACLMMRKELYLAVGGMDEQAFKVSYNDVDLCLKAHDAGFLIVWTPHAVVMHEGGISQTTVDVATQEGKRMRLVGEQDALYGKWLSLLARDPAYNKNLSLNGKGFELETDVHLTWRPLVWRPHPIVLAHPADAWGCGNYRITKPFSAMATAGLIDGMLAKGLLHVIDLERYDPDVIVLQRQTADDQLEAIRRMQAFSRAFKVYELDDYLPNLPIKSVHRKDMPKDVMRSLRRGLGYVDRFVVSTQPLAEAFSGLHDNIHVIENCLPVEWWKGLTSQRRRGRKPRVGWAGGVGHAGDLELIVDVVKELVNEVEWVFFGMCPEKLRGYVHEVHAGIDIERYPAALAALDLDLALAPLEQNLFNECKSSLRLLEYGACGFPVICTDIRCYQGDLPVTRVKNRFRDWVEAIRMHITDLDATAQQGDALKQAVLQGWMLEGENLELWRKAWLPN